MISLPLALSMRKVKCFKKDWPNTAQASGQFSGMTPHSTCSTMNFPTRTVLAYTNLHLMVWPSAEDARDLGVARRRRQAHLSGDLVGQHDARGAGIDRQFAGMLPVESRRYGPRSPSSRCMGIVSVSTFPSSFFRFRSTMAKSLLGPSLPRGGVALLTSSIAA